MDLSQLVTTDNVAIAVLLVVVWKLWDRYTKVEDKKTDMAIAFTESTNEQISAMGRAIDKLESAARVPDGPQE